MAGSNDRNKSFSGAKKGSWSGRSDYNSGRPKSATSGINTEGDKGIPSGISSSKEYTEKNGTQFAQEAGDKGIPPMKANPSETSAPKVSGGGIRD